MGKERASTNCRALGGAEALKDIVSNCYKLNIQVLSVSHFLRKLEKTNSGSKFNNESAAVLFKKKSTLYIKTMLEL